MVSHFISENSGIKWKKNWLDSIKVDIMLNLHIFMHVITNGMDSGANGKTTEYQLL